MNDFWLRLRALVAPRRVERELEEELAFHIEMETRKQLAAGAGLVEARARARARFGSTASAADHCRDARGIGFIETSARDVRYAIRGFLRTPTVAATVVATIALGLGLSASVFTIFNAVVFRPQPVRDPGALFRYSWSTREGERHQFTFEEYKAFNRENVVFSDAFASRPDVNVRINGRLTNGELVTGNFFRVLGVGASLGRTLTPEDSSAFGGAAVVVLSDNGWRRLFAADPTIVGRAIQIRGFRFDVVGITPEGFGGGVINSVDFWAPLTMVDQLERRPWQPLEDPGGLQIIGRLKPGMSAAAARSALEPWSEATASGLPGDRRPTGVRLEPRGTAAPLSLESLLVFSPLFAAFGLILLIACANVANLMLARALARQREIATRLALGASRRRLIRQLLTESLVLALAAACGALLISRVVVDLATRVLVGTMPPEFAEIIRLGPLPTDVRVAFFVVGVAVIAAALFGLMPALHATRTNLHQASRGETRPGRARSALIVVQITACALLLICAGVMLRSAQRAASRDPGIRMSDTIVIDNMPDEGSRSAVVAAVASEPLVQSFVAASPAPILSRSQDGMASANGREGVPALYRFVSANYFEVLDVGIVSGRAFTPQEAMAHANVAVVSETAARQLWSGGNAIGQTLRVTPAGQLPRDNDPLIAPRVVVVTGVVRDVRGVTDSGNGSDHTGVYLPGTPMDAGMTLIARARGDVEVARQAVTERVTAADPRTNMILSMRTIGSLQTYPLQVGFWVTVVLGFLALVLTLTGIYGVLSYLVVQRTREIGVRIALGATPGAVARLVQWQSLRLVVIGLAIACSLAGSVSAILVATLPVSGPFAGTIQPFDAVAYAASLLTVVAACVFAASIPALRAARIDPCVTLRHD